MAVSGVLRRIGPPLRRGGFVGALVLLLGIGAAALMVIGEFATYRSIEVITASCEELTRATPEVADDCVTSGGEQHGWALLPIAVLTLIMAWGAGPGGSRAAAAAVGLLGVVPLAFAVIGDIPDVDVTGAVGRNFDQAEGEAGPTIGLEIAAGISALAASALALAFGRSD